ETSRAPGRRRDPWHVAQDEDGRGDVSQTEGVRRRGPSARGAETQQARGGVTWQQLSTTGQGGGKPPRRVCFFGLETAPSASTAAPLMRSSPPKPFASRFAGH